MPRMRSPIETIVSAPMTQLLGYCRAMSIALASANFLTYSGGEDIGTVLSSKLPGITVNARPACFNRYRRRGDLEAKIKRGSVSVSGIRSLLTNAAGFDNDVKISEKKIKSQIAVFIQVWMKWIIRTCF